jgi:hypothetical protein
LEEIAITTSHVTDPDDTLPTVIKQAVRSLRRIQDMPITSPFLSGIALVIIPPLVVLFFFAPLIVSTHSCPVSVMGTNLSRLDRMQSYAIQPAMVAIIVYTVMLALNGCQTSLLRVQGF